MTDDDSFDVDEQHRPPTVAGIAQCDSCGARETVALHWFDRDEPDLPYTWTRIDGVDCCFLCSSRLLRAFRMVRCCTCSAAIDRDLAHGWIASDPDSIVAVCADCHQDLGPVDTWPDSVRL